MELKLKVKRQNSEAGKDKPYWEEFTLKRPGSDRPVAYMPCIASNGSRMAH